MSKYIIKWDSGYGESYEVLDFDSEEEAMRSAYEGWREEAESNANYGAELYTEELAEEYGLD